MSLDNSESTHIPADDLLMTFSTAALCLLTGPQSQSLQGLTILLTLAKLAQAQQVVMADGHTANSMPIANHINDKNLAILVHIPLPTDIDIISLVEEITKQYQKERLSLQKTKQLLNTFSQHPRHGYFIYKASLQNIINPSIEQLLNWQINPGNAIEQKRLLSEAKIINKVAFNAMQQSPLFKKYQSGNQALTTEFLQRHRAHFKKDNDTDHQPVKPQQNLLA